MEYFEIATENATPVSVVGKAPRKQAAAGLPAYLQTAQHYAPALGCVAKKSFDASNASSKALIAKGAQS